MSLSDRASSFSLFNRRGSWSFKPSTPTGAKAHSPIAHVMDHIAHPFRTEREITDNRIHNLEETWFNCCVCNNGQPWEQIGAGTPFKGQIKCDRPSCLQAVCQHCQVHGAAFE